MKNANLNVYSYKEAKTIKEQVSHLIEYKNIDEKTIDDDSHEFLLKFNYINVITPFKYKFAEYTIENGRPKYIKTINEGVNRHIYKEKTSFNEYKKSFIRERENYGKIANGIISFETTFKSLVNYHLFTDYYVDTDLELLRTIRTFKENIELLNLGYEYSHEKRIANRKRKKHMSRSFDKIIDDLEGVSDKYPFRDGNKVKNIYVYFDKMTLKSIINIFYCLDREIQDEIFSKMFDYNLSLNVETLSSFKERIFNIVTIRDCIMHSNSLEIVYLFSDINNNIFRTIKSRTEYELIVKALEQIGERNNLY